MLKDCIDMLHTLQTGKITKDKGSYTDLSSLTNIGTIEAYGISITNAALQSIANGAANLIELSMLSCDIDDKTLKLIANLTNLQILDLGDNKITALTPLANLTMLEEVDLLGNHIQSYRLASLEKQLPGCKIGSSNLSLK